MWNPDNAQDTSGTPGYMAPEVMCRQNHGVAVDYFPLGVIGYECMFGRRPYLGRNRKEIRDHILAKQVQIKKHEVPESWSLKAADFINKVASSAHPDFAEEASQPARPERARRGEGPPLVR